MAKKKTGRPNYPLIDFSGASDETTHSILKALSEAEKTEKQKAKSSTRVIVK